MPAVRLELRGEAEIIVPTDEFKLSAQFDEAEKLLLQTREVQRRVWGPDNPRAADTTYYLAIVALRRGNRDSAFSILREALQHGLAPASALGMDSDPDLKPLHGDPRF